MPAPPGFLVSVQLWRQVQLWLQGQAQVQLPAPGQVHPSGNISHAPACLPACHQLISKSPGMAWITQALALMGAEWVRSGHVVAAVFAAIMG